jgi:restriction system protein
MSVPKSYYLYNDVLLALKRLGGSASITELDEEVTRNLKLTSDEIAFPHDERQTELQYQLAWARTYLKKFGLVSNSARGVWVLTPAGKSARTVDPTEVRRYVEQQSSSKQKPRGKGTAKSPQSNQPSLVEPDIAEAVLEEKWKKDLLDVLLRLSPGAFERLCQRLLRESGFVQVRVTGKTGDGGIDGVGLVQIGGLLSFPVLFQCKRYRGSLGAGIIRDFRGAMTGRSDRGLELIS